MRPQNQESSSRNLPARYWPTASELFGYGPLTFMRRLSENMDRMWGDLRHTGGEMLQGTWMPRIEVLERDKELCVRAELPGLRKEDVQVEIDDDRLVIQGERQREKKDEKDGYFTSERSYGRFYREIPLPAGAENDKAKAHFEAGLLEVTVPTPEHVKRRRQIPLEAGSSARREIPTS